ncbi:MAG TPA: TonB-dependent receptor plug domain-containing protein [Flavihumibacter sp.]|nr:TonB-dependent receptor plug domain-containing protein [Flavihumibacter sp.]
MKKMFLGICAFSMMYPLMAQNRTVVVADVQTRQPLPGASIDFSNGDAILSDHNGRIQIGSRAGKISVSSIGYKTSSLPPDAFGDTIFLERYNLFLQPVEVRALRAGDRAPFARTNISAKEIAGQNLGQDLPFLLNQTPSVTVSSDAGNGIGYTGIRIRGTDATRINMTLNGIPYNDAESQGMFLVNLPDFASSVGSIQVQRGVGTSSNGAGAFGASINMSTNEFRGDAYGELNNSYGSFNTWKNTVKAGSGLINGHFTIDARLSRISSDGYIDRASSNLHSFYISGAWITPRSSVRLNVFSGKEKTYQAWNGILEQDVATCRTCNTSGTEKPGEPYKNETDNYQQDHYQLFFNHAFNENLSLNVAGFLTRGRGYYENYKASQSFSKYGLANPVIGDSTIEKTDLVRQLWLDNYYYGAIYSLLYKNKGTQFSFGGGANRYDGNHYGKVIWAATGFPVDYEWYRHKAVKSDINVYGKWQQQLTSALSSFVDLQYRHVTYQINGFRDNPELRINNQYNFFNPKLGLNYRQNNWNLYASLAVANKEPNRDDFEAGANTQPKYESLYDWELGLDKRYSKASWALNLYYMRYHNQLVLTGKINDVGAYTRTNIPNSHRLGVELQGNWRPASWLQVNGNITVSENKVLNFTEYIDNWDDGSQETRQYKKTDISFSPALIGAGSIQITPFKQADITLSGKYVGKQYLDNTSNNARSLKGYYVQDLRLHYTVSEKLFRETTFIIQVNNLFNKLYVANGYTYSYLYEKLPYTENYVFPMAGINWMGGVNIRL